VLDLDAPSPQNCWRFDLPAGGAPVRGIVLRGIVMRASGDQAALAAASRDEADVVGAFSGQELTNHAGIARDENEE
jgi:hypothetical protein